MFCAVCLLWACTDTQGQRVDVASEAAASVLLSDAGLENQSKLSLMTVANASAAAAASAEPTEAMLLVAIDVESADLANRESEITSIHTELDALAATFRAVANQDTTTTTTSGEGPANEGVTMADKVAVVASIQGRLRQFVVDLEKTQLRLDALRVNKKMETVRDARRLLIEKASVLLKSAGA